MAGHMCGVPQVCAAVADTAVITNSMHFRPDLTPFRTELTIMDRWNPHSDARAPKLA
jgi:hypothetical protein